MKAFVDPDTCIGCSLCVQSCPEVFKMEQDKAVAYVNPVPVQAEDSCRRAAEECPVDAIKITEAAGEKFSPSRELGVIFPQPPEAGEK